MVGGGWRLAVDGWWRLAADGGWQLVVGGGWRLAVPGGLSFRAVRNNKRKSGFLRTALGGGGVVAWCAWVCVCFFEGRR